MAGPDDVEIWRLGDVPPAGDLFVAGAPSVGVGFLDGGAEIVTAGPTSYHMWSLDGAPVRTILLGKFGASATLLPDGARLGASGPEGVRILDATSGAVLRTFTTRPHTGIALVDHGRLLAAIGVDDGRITAWNLADGSERWHSDPPGYAYLFGGPEGQLVALRRTDPVEVLSPADGRVTRVSDGKGVFYAGISGNGRWGVIALTDGRVEVVDTVAAAIVDTVQPYDALDRRVSISDDGRLVAAGGSDRAIRVWDRVVGRVVAVLRGHRQSMQSLAFSPDGRLLLSSAWAGEVRSWDLSDLETPGAVLLQRAEKAANLDLDGIRLRPAEGAPDAALVDGASTP
jgi:WD40 repeat protein